MSQESDRVYQLYLDDKSEFETEYKKLGIEDMSDVQARIAEDAARVIEGAPTSEYERKRAARIDRFKTLAQKNNTLSKNLSDRAHRMADQIPLGQPILVGHNSEARDRRYRNRIQGTFEKSIEVGKKAEHYERKAAGAERNDMISSDDPHAIKKLEAEIAEAELMQKVMVECNKVIRNKKMSDEDKVKKVAEIGRAAGIDEEQARVLLRPDCLGNVGYPSFKTSNNSANIKRMKDRLELLKKTKDDVTTEFVYNGVRVVDNVEDNRVQLFYPGKPSQDVINTLRSNGFIFYRTGMCWQRRRNTGGMRYVMIVLGIKCGTCTHLKLITSFDGICIHKSCEGRSEYNKTMRKDYTGCEHHPDAQPMDPVICPRCNRILGYWRDGEPEPRPYDENGAPIDFMDMVTRYANTEEKTFNQPGIHEQYPDFICMTCYHELDGHIEGQEIQA